MVLELDGTEVSRRSPSTEARPMESWVKCSELNSWSPHHAPHDAVPEAQTQHDHVTHRHN